MQPHRGTEAAWEPPAAPMSPHAEAGTCPRSAWTYRPEQDSSEKWEGTEKKEVDEPLRK